MREFRYLVPGPGRTKDTCVLLTFTEAELRKKLVVWSKANYHYYVFDGVREYETWAGSKAEGERLFFEVVEGGSQQRLKLDFDTVPTLDTLERCMTAVKGAWSRLYGGKAAALYVFKTSREGYHVIIDMFVSGVEEAKRFAEAVGVGLGDEYRDALDMRVYGKRQNFRIAGCAKDTGGFAKRLLNGSASLEQTLVGLYSA
jgi:hypothetical protein